MKEPIIILPFFSVPYNAALRYRNKWLVRTNFQEASALPYLKVKVKYFPPLDELVAMKKQDLPERLHGNIVEEL